MADSPSPPVPRDDESRYTDDDDDESRASTAGADDEEEHSSLPAGGDAEGAQGAKKKSTVQLFRPVFVVPSAIAKTANMLLFIPLTEVDKSFDALFDAVVETIPLPGGEYTALRARDLAWSMPDLAAYSQMLSKIPQFKGLIAWQQDGTLAAYANLSAQAQGYLEKAENEGGYEPLYVFSNAFVTSASNRLAAIQIEEAMNIREAEKYFNVRPLLPRYDEDVEALRAYVAEDGREFWPCDMPNGQRRNELFPRHWCSRYDAAVELIKTGVLLRQNYLVKEGRYFESSHVLEALAPRPKILLNDGGCGMSKSVSFWNAMEARIASGERMCVVAISIRDRQGDDMRRVALGKDGHPGIDLLRHKPFAKGSPEFLASDFVECSVESTYKLEGWADKHSDFFLLLDELPDILSILSCSSTIRSPARREQAAQILVDLARKAKTIICLRANMRAQDVRAVLSWLEAEPKPLVRMLSIKRHPDEKPQRKIIVPLRSAADGKKLLSHLYQSGAAVSSSCGSRKMADELDLMAKRLGIKRVTLTAFSDDSTWKDAEKDRLGSHLGLNFTQAAGAGFSVDTAGHFSYGMMFCNPQLSVEAHSQAGERARDVANADNERIFFVTMPRASTSDENTSSEAVEERMKRDAEANARRQGTDVAQRHSVLFPLKVDVVSQVETDRYDFVGRYFSEVRRAGYEISTDFNVPRATRIEEARDYVDYEQVRVDACIHQVDAMLKLEQDDVNPGETYHRLIKERRQRGQKDEGAVVELTADEKRYLALGERIRTMGFSALKEIVKDHAQAIWWDDKLVLNIGRLWKYEQGPRPNPKAPKPDAKGMSAFARDDALRRLLKMLLLSGLRASTAYIDTRELAVGDREYLSALYADFPAQFLQAVQAEDVAVGKANGEKKPAWMDPPAIPAQCFARLALRFANILLQSSFGVSLKHTKVTTYTPALNPKFNPEFTLDANAEEIRDFVKKHVGSKTPRQKGPDGKNVKAIALYSLECSAEVHFMYAVLVQSPSVSKELKAQFVEFCAPVAPDAGLKLVRAKLEKAKQGLKTLEENIEEALAPLKTNQGPRRRFSKRAAPVSAEPRVADVKRPKIENAD